MMVPKIFIGTDIVEISRFDSRLISSESYLNLCFTQDEQRYCLSQSIPAQHFAVRFAAKEAVIKALSGINRHLEFNKIEIKRRDDGRPYVRLITNDSVMSDLSIDISLSHSKDFALAFVIIVENVEGVLE